MKRVILAVVVMVVGLAGVARAGVSAQFNLLTWDDSQAMANLPSAVGSKPADGLDASDDWLIFTGDDASLGTAFNPAGALSHNLAQLTGASGPQFNNAPSLTGSLILNFTPGGGNTWSVVPRSGAYTGVATPVMQMNQFLVGPGDPGAQNAIFNVDGLVTPGTWQSDASGDWAISYAMDFYFATNADGDPSPADIDATFSNASQTGYLIPVDQLTSSGMTAVNLTSPSGFFAGDFEQYLLDEITARLPADATYLLVTQMGKVNPVYAEAGLPISTSTLVGNTTIAYTTQVIPEPTSLALLLASGVSLAFRRRRPLVTS